jgi:pimeloyl-ACP methyl ester carboxylesterase
VKGQGDLTVVFIHCWTCNHQFWNPQIDYFSRSHRVLWLDLAGHGSSGSNRNHYTMQAFAEDVSAVVNRAGGDNPVVLVGHSMGGPVAIETAKLLGDRVIGIVGVDTFYTPFEWPKTEAKIQEFVKPFEDDFRGTSENMVRSMFTPHADPQVIDWVLKQLSTAEPEMGISAMYSIFRWSADNNPGTLQQYAGMLRNINGAPTGEETELDESVILVPRVGHFPAQVKPEEFNQILETILIEFQAH